MSVYRVVRIDETAQRIALTREDGLSELLLEGSVLDAQTGVASDRTVLWLTEGSPYEEGLHIYLVGRDGTVLDAIEGGAPYSPGILEILSASHLSIEFRFFKTDAIYVLHVSPAARLRWFLPNGFRYKRALSRHYMAVSEGRQKG